MTFFKQAQT